MYSTDLIRAAKDALERPSDFGYAGDLPLFETWGLCGPSQHRDADALARSNFDVISEDLEERFPDDVERVSSSHWAVGWSETLAVRVLANEERPSMPIDWKLTDAFLALLKWRDALEDYPVADDERHSQLEHEELVEYCDGLPAYRERDALEYVTIESDDIAERFARLASDLGWSRAEDVREETLLDAAIDAGIYVLDVEPVRELLGALERERDALATAILDAERGVIDARELREIALDASSLPRSLA